MSERPIPGFEGRYTVTEDGVVASYVRSTPRIMKVRIAKDGYPVVSLAPGDGSKARWFRLHRLVLLAFVGPCPEGMEGRHRDGNPLHCALTNLSWSTHGENLRDKRSHGTDHNIVKTHCSRNHPLSGENLRIRTNRGWIERQCRACDAINSKQYRDRKRI